MLVQRTVPDEINFNENYFLIFWRGQNDECCYAESRIEICSTSEWTPRKVREFRPRQTFFRHFFCRKKFAPPKFENTDLKKLCFPSYFWSGQPLVRWRYAEKKVWGVVPCAPTLAHPLKGRLQIYAGKFTWKILWQNFLTPKSDRSWVGQIKRLTWLPRKRPRKCYSEITP